MVAQAPPEFYLSNNYAPVRTEDDYALEITGQFPKDLRGALYRNGPNPQFQPRDPNHHWFGGDGMVHGFFVEDGKVHYRNRYVRTPKWHVENAAGRSLFGSMGNPRTTDPSVQGQDSGVANTNILAHGGRLLALEEGHMPFEMDARSLDSLGYVDAYKGRVTAHPKIDPVSGEMLWFGYGVGTTPFSPGMSFGVTDANGAVTRRDDFQAPYCSMVHDFMATRNHVLFPVLPLTGSMDRAMQGKPIWAWEPEQAAYVGVLRRDADVSTIRWYNTGACYVFHTMNAWEADGKIMCDVMRFDEAPFPRADGSLGQAAFPRLVRWTFDLSPGSDAIVEEALDDLDGEFPRFDDRRATQSYRHGWFAADPGHTFELTAIAHLDLATGKRQVYTLPPGDLTSEPVFVERSADAEEGDGWLLSVVWRASENRSDLVVFDAQDVAKGPIATARAPRRVPFGFHGNWVNA